MRTSVTIKTDATFGKEQLPNVYLIRKICKDVIKDGMKPEDALALIKQCPTCMNKYKFIKREVKLENGCTKEVHTYCGCCRGLGFIIDLSNF